MKHPLPTLSRAFSCREPDMSGRACQSTEREPHNQLYEVVGSGWGFCEHGDAIRAHDALHALGTRVLGFWPGRPPVTRPICRDRRPTCRMRNACRPVGNGRRSSSGAGAGGDRTIGLALGWAEAVGATNGNSRAKGRQLKPTGS